MTSLVYIYIYGLLKSQLVNGLFQLTKVHPYGRALIKSGGFLAKNSLFLEGWQCYGKFNEVLGGYKTVLIVSRGQIS